MKRLAAVVLLLASGVVAWAQDDPEPPAKGKELSGDWVFSKVIGKGPGAPPGDLELTFRKDKMIVKAGNQERMSHTFTIDTKKKPAHINFTDSNNGKKVEGIYKIEKGELYLAIGERTGKRPADFDGKDEPVIVVKRPKK